MAALILPSRRVVQPQGPVEFDPRFGLSPIGLYLPAAGRLDALNYKAFSGGSALNTRASLAGMAGLQNANNTGIYRAATDLQSVNEYTVIWHGVPIGAPTGSTPSFVGIANSTASQSASVLSLDYASTTTLSVFFKTGGSLGSRTGTITWANTFGKVITLIASYSATEGLIKLHAAYDGAVFELLRSAVTSAQAPTLLGTEQLTVGGDVIEMPSRHINASTAFAGQFYGALRDSQIDQVARSPWQLFRPIQRRIWVPVAGGGATNYSLTADVGSYSLTGVDAGVRFSPRVTAEVGSYALTGIDAGLTYSRRLLADVGSYSLTGVDATLTYVPASGAYTLTADTGSYTLTGNDAGLTFARSMTADVGSYTLNGVNAGLLVGRRLTADTGAYVLAGVDADLIYTALGPTAYALTAETGSYVLGGVDAALRFSGEQTPFGGGFFAQALRRKLFEDELRTKLKRLPDQVADVIEDAVILAIDQPKQPSAKELRQAFEAENIPYREAYRKAVVSMVQQVRQREEDDEEEEATALAFLI